MLNELAVSFYTCSLMMIPCELKHVGASVWEYTASIRGRASWILWVECCEPHNGFTFGALEGLLDEVEGVSPSAEASTNFWPTTLISEIETD